MNMNAYTTREIDQFLKAADDKTAAYHEKLMDRMDNFEDNTRSALTRIEEQTKKTNGAVANLKTWRTYTVGFIAGLALAFAFLAFFVGQVFIPLTSSLIQNGNKL